MHSRRPLLIAAAFLFGPISSILSPSVFGDDWPSPPTSWSDVYNPYVLRSFNIQITEANYLTVQTDETFDIKVPATFWLDGDGVLDPETGETIPTHHPLRIRRKSATPIGEKISYRFDFGSARWYDIKEFSMENGDDNNVVSEGLSWYLHRLSANEHHQPGLAAWASLTIHVEKQVPVLDDEGSPIPALDDEGKPVEGEDGLPVYLMETVIERRPQGVYLNVELPDKHFLRHRGLWDETSTWLYKQDDIGLPELKETADGFDSPAYLALSYVPFQEGRKHGKKITNPAPDDATLEADLNFWINMDSMLRVGAVNAFTDNPDELFNKGKNFFWVDFVDQPRLYFPWDLDSSIRTTTAGIYGTTGSGKGKNSTVSQHPYQSEILNHPAFRAQYNQTLLDLLDGPLDPAAVAGDLDVIEAVLTEALLADPNNKIGNSPADVAAHFESLRLWLAARAANVRSQIEANNSPPPRTAD